MRNKRSAILAASASAVAVLFLTGVAPAEAYTNDHTSYCTSADAGEACFYYNGNLGGAVAGYHQSDVANFSDDVYGGTASGHGQRVKNNAASAKNTYGGARNVYVYYNENFSGPYDVIAPLKWKNLVNAWNNNASYEFF